MADAPGAQAEQGAFGWVMPSAEQRSGAGLPTPDRPGELPPAEPPPVRRAARRALRASTPGAVDVARPAPSSQPRSQAPLPPDDELWDVHATARFLKRSVSWVYHKAEDGTLPVRRLGGWGLRFIPGELRAWVEAGAGDRRAR